VRAKTYASFGMRERIDCMCTRVTRRRPVVNGATCAVEHGLKFVVANTVADVATSTESGNEKTIIRQLMEKLSSKIECIEGARVSI